MVVKTIQSTLLTPKHGGEAEKKGGGTLVKETPSLDEELEKAWEWVQRRLYCYDLPFPRIEEDTPNNPTRTACINMVNHQITINKKFIDYLASKGLDYQTILRGVLSHEAGHFKVMPWDLKNFLVLLFHAEKICNDKKDKVTNYFMDVSLNLELILNKHNNHLYEVYKHLDKKSRIDNLLGHLYSLKTGLDFNNPRLPRELKKHLLELGRIRFTNNKKKVYKNLKRFAGIIKDLVNEEDSEKEKELGNSTDGNLNYPDYSLSRIDTFGIEAYDKNEIRRALKEIAEELRSPSDFIEVYEFVRRIEKEANRRRDNKSKGLGVGIGTRKVTSEEPESNSLLEALIEFYTVKSESHMISIKEKECHRSSKNLMKSELRPWEAEDPYLNIDVFNSYGKFFPNITKSWDYSDTQQGRQESRIIPDLLLMIDSSGSMIDPAKKNSNAVLGAICAARQYLRRGSSVAVINFSTFTKAYGFSQEYKKIAERIIQYQGGWTMLSEKAINKLISGAQREVDIMLITDGGIWNLNKIMTDLNKRSNTNRITIIHIPLWSDLSDYHTTNPGSKEEAGKINIYRVRRESDIPKIVIKDMTKGGVM